jgi:hypothetical protein
MKPGIVGIEMSKFREMKLKALNCHKAGGVLSDEEIEVFMSETEKENGHFEIFQHVVLL